MITINDVKNAKIGDTIVSGYSMIGSSGFGDFEAIIRKISKNSDKVCLEIVKNDYCLDGVFAKVALIGKTYWYDVDSFPSIFAIIPQQIPQIPDSDFETNMKNNIEKMRNELSQMENSLKEFKKKNVHKNPELEIGTIYRMIKDTVGSSYYFYPVYINSDNVLAINSKDATDTYYIDSDDDNIFEICTDPEMLKIQDSFNKFFGI